MCGIVGYVGKTKIQKSRVIDACNLLKHRGPDDKGFYFEKVGKNFVYFGHRRLSIIDLNKRSNQPFRFKNNVLIFNGEIYNYKELKKELEELGYNFRTNGDTEVLSYSLHCWGVKAFKKLDGMWSFAWLNGETGDVLLSRDRFGEKPLYIWPTESGIFFASEIKALKKLTGLVSSINKTQIYRYLTNGYKSICKKNQTFFKEINQIEHSTYLIIKKNFVVEKKKYWSPNFFQDEKLNYDESVDITRELLIKSVKRKIRSDVPIAFCMSGGIDSNSLISIAKKVLNYNVHGFTIKNKDERYNEKKLVDFSLNHLKIKHTYVSTDRKNFLDNLTNQIKFNDAPISTISYYLHAQLMKAMSNKGYKVSISGTGADEIFTGYYDHHLFYLNAIKRKKFFKQSLLGWKKNISQIVRNPFLKDFKKFSKLKDKRKHIYLNKSIFENYLYKNWSEEFYEKKFTKDTLRNRMANEMFYESVPVILHADDMNAMANSIENRSPFLDKELFEFGNKIPTKFLIKNGFSKSILRDAMKGIVSKKVLEIPQKKGFNASLQELINFKDPKIKERLLDDSFIFEIIKKEKIEKLLKNNNLQNSYSKYLFNFINTKIFLENFQN